MENNFKIEFSSLFSILAMAKWKIKDLPLKDEEDLENLEICKKLQDFLLNQEKTWFEIKGSDPF